MGGLVRVWGPGQGEPSAHGGPSGTACQELPCHVVPVLSQCCPSVVPVLSHAVPHPPHHTSMCSWWCENTQAGTTPQGGVFCPCEWYCCGEGFPRGSQQHKSHVKQSFGCKVMAKCAFHLDRPVAGPWFGWVQEEHGWFTIFWPKGSNPPDSSSIRALVVEIQKFFFDKAEAHFQGAQNGLKSLSLESGSQTDQGCLVVKTQNSHSLGCSKPSTKALWQDKHANSSATTPLQWGLHGGVLGTCWGCSVESFPKP